MLGSSVNRSIVRDVDLDGSCFTFDWKGFKGCDGCFAFREVATSDEDMVFGRRKEKVFSKLKA